jgi:hypothetical protein
MVAVGIRNVDAEQAVEARGGAEILRDDADGGELRHLRSLT